MAIVFLLKLSLHGMKLCEFMLLIINTCCVLPRELKQKPPKSYYFSPVYYHISQGLALYLYFFQKNENLFEHFTGFQKIITQNFEVI